MRELEATWTMTRDPVAAWMVVSTEMGIGEDRVGGVDSSCCRAQAVECTGSKAVACRPL